MPLTREAKNAFNSLVIRSISQKTPQELEAVSLDKQKFLDELLESNNFNLRREMQYVTSLYQSARNPFEDEQAYNCKTRIDKSPESLIFFADKNELLAYLGVILNSNFILKKKELDRVSVVGQSIFSPEEVSPEITQVLDASSSLTV